MTHHHQIAYNRYRVCMSLGRWREYVYIGSPLEAYDYYSLLLSIPHELETGTKLELIAPDGKIVREETIHEGKPRDKKQVV